MLIVLAGPSTVGKNHLCDAAKSRGHGFVVPVTSRDIRPNEAVGVDYEFLSKSDFQIGIREGSFFEWDYSLGAYYGSRLEKIYRAAYSEEIWFMHALARISVRMKSRLGDQLHSVLLKPGRLDALESRLVERGYGPDEMSARRLHWAEELDHETLLDQSLENADSIDSHVGIDAILRATNW